MEATAGRFKTAGRQKLFTECRSPTRIQGPFADSNWEERASFSEQQTVGTLGLNRRITRCRKAQTLFMRCPSPMPTRARLSATPAFFFKPPTAANNGTVNRL